MAHFLECRGHSLGGWEHHLQQERCWSRLGGPRIFGGPVTRFGGLGTPLPVARCATATQVNCFLEPRPAARLASFAKELIRGLEPQMERARAAHMRTHEQQPAPTMDFIIRVQNTLIGRW